MEPLNEVKKVNYTRIIIIAVIVVAVVILLIYGVSFLNNVRKASLQKQNNASADLPREFKQMYGLNVNTTDTDGDGYSDKDEINLYQTNPLDANSKPAQ